jgi:hypothetical protein
VWPEAIDYLRIKWRKAIARPPPIAQAHDGHLPNVNWRTTVHVRHGCVGVAANVASNSMTIVIESLQLNDPVDGDRSNVIANGAGPSAFPPDDQTI